MASLRTFHLKSQIPSSSRPYISPSIPRYLPQILRPTLHPQTNNRTTTISNRPRANSPTTSFFQRFFGAKMVSAAAIAKAEAIINEHPVAVFSKSWCPYCTSTKSLLTQLGANFYVLELDEVDDGSDIQAALAQITGQSSVPNIFIKQKHIGGNSDLQARRRELPQLLKDAGAL